MREKQHYTYTYVVKNGIWSLLLESLMFDPLYHHEEDHFSFSLINNKQANQVWGHSCQSQVHLLYILFYAVDHEYKFITVLI